MPIDTSMYQAQPNNLVGQLGQWQSLANAQEQNTLMKQQEQRQNIAISLEQAQKYSTQLELTSQELARVYGADNGNPTRDHIIDAASNLIAKNPGIFSKDNYATMIQDLPSEDKVAKDPNAVRNWIVSKALMNERGKQALQPHLPNYQGVDYGGGKKLVDMNPITNPGATGSQMVGGLSPESQAAPRDWIDPNTGRPVHGTQSEYLRAAQQGNPNPGGGNVAPGTILPPGGAPQPQGGPQAGVVPGRAMPQAEAAPPAGGPVLAKAGPLEPGEGISAPAGAEQAAAVSGAENAKQAMALQNEFQDTRSRSGMLANLEDLSSKFSGGPWAPEVGMAKGIANQATGGVAFKDSLAAQEEFRKISTQLAQRQMSAMGGTGSAEHLASAAASNPSEKLSTAGARKIVHMLRGNEDALAATYSAWNDYQKQHGGAASYGDFLGEFNKTFEPRAYQLQYMDKPEAAEMLKNMTPAERSRVADAYVFAKSKGWLKPGQGQPTAGQ